MMLFDWVLILLAVFFAVTGFGQRLTVTLGWLLGFIVGLLLGRFLGIWLYQLVTGADQASPTVSAALPLAVGIVFSIAGTWVGATLRDAITSRLARGLDAAAGAVSALVAFALIVWLGAGWIRVSPLVTLNSWVAESRIVAGLDRVSPVEATEALGEINSVLAKNGFPRVFSGQPERIRNVGAPDADMSAVGRAVQRSTVKVITDRTRCGNVSEGSGWVFKNGYIATNAHVVAGSSHPTVQIGGTGRPYSAAVVSFDPDRDIAVLRVSGLHASALSLGSALERSADAVVVGYPQNGPYTISPARVRERLEARGLDIYGQSTVVRNIYSLRAVVRPGNSGGPLLDSSGKVTGMVFAKSASDDQTGYALTLAEIQKTLTSAAGHSKAVSTGACAAD